MNGYNFYMTQSRSIIACGLFLSLTLVFWITLPAQAMPPRADSPYDLINAVNALRGSYGLPPYSVNSILMYTAQAQADFMAATGNVTHFGPGGIGVTDRLLAAGYPLAGDLSLGGFRSENITGGNESMTAQTAVNQWTGDAPHLNTMISPSLTEIGAGVAVANGRVYYVIDCALPTTSGAPQTASGGATAPSGGAVIPAVIVSTPNENGEVFHEVQPSQTLWQIAIAYNVKIDEIKSSNNLADNTIYPGDVLLINAEVIQVSPTPAIALTPVPAISVAPTAASNAAPSEPVSTPVSEDDSVEATNSTAIMSFAIGVIAMTLLVGGYLAWRGGENPNSD